MTKTRKAVAKRGILSKEIDPLLLEGGHRPVEIANLLVEKFGGEFSKGKIVNNIRSRVVFLTSKKGYRVVKDGKNIQLVQGSGSLQLNTDATSASNDAGENSSDVTQLNPDVPVSETNN